MPPPVSDGYVGHVKQGAAGKKVEGLGRTNTEANMSYSLNSVKGVI